MAKVYLARGHGIKPDGGFDPGAVGKDSGGYLWTEQKMADIATPVIASRLKAAGVTVKDEGTDDPNYVGSTKAANDWGADLCISIHADWTGGLDFHTLFWHTSTKGKECATDIVNVVKATGHKVAGVKPRSDLYLLKNTSMPAVIVEMGRIGSATIDTAVEIEALAVLVADGILGYLGIKPPAPPPKPDPVEPDPKEWKFPTAAQALLEAGIYSDSTKPGTVVTTDNLSAYLHRMMHWLEKTYAPRGHRHDGRYARRDHGEHGGGSGLTEPQVRALIDTHAANPDAHHE